MTDEMVGVADYVCGHTHVSETPWKDPLRCPTCGEALLSSRAMRASEAPKRGDS